MTKPRRPNPGGQPTKLNSRLQARIVRWLEGGNTMESAAAVVGIGSSAARDWMRRGARELVRIEGGGKPEPKEARFAEFCRAVRIAEAKPKANAVRAFTSATKQEWQAARDWLKVRFPGEWSERVYVIVQQQLDDVLSRFERAHADGVFDDDTYRRILETISREDGPAEAPPSAGHDPL